MTPQAQIQALFAELVTRAEEQPSAPTATDDINSNYMLLSYWLHEKAPSEYDLYICRDNTANAAIWTVYADSTTLSALDDFNASLKAEVIATIINGAIDRSDVYLFENTLSGLDISNAITAIEATANAAELEVNTITYDFTDFSEYANQDNATTLETLGSQAGATFEGNGKIQPMGLGIVKPELNKARGARVRGRMKTLDFTKNKTFQFAFVDDNEVVINFVEFIDLSVANTTEEFIIDFPDVLTVANTATQLVGRYELKVLDGSSNHLGDFFLIDVEIY